MSGILLSKPLDYPTLCVIYLLVLHSLATRWYYEQMKPPEINSFVNYLTEKIKAPRNFIFPSLMSDKLCKSPYNTDFVICTKHTKRE